MKVLASLRLAPRTLFAPVTILTAQNGGDRGERDAVRSLARSSISAVSSSADGRGPRLRRMYAGRGPARKKSREVAYSRRGC